MSSSVISLDFKVFPVDVIHLSSRLILRYFVEIARSTRALKKREQGFIYLGKKRTIRVESLSPLWALEVVNRTLTTTQGRVSMLFACAYSTSDHALMG